MENIADLNLGFVNTSSSETIFPDVRGIKQNNLIGQIMKNVRTILECRDTVLSNRIIYKYVGNFVEEFLNRLNNMIPNLNLDLSKDHTEDLLEHNGKLNNHH